MSLALPGQFLHHGGCEEEAGGAGRKGGGSPLLCKNHTQKGVNRTAGPENWVAETPWEPLTRILSPRDS